MRDTDTRVTPQYASYASAGQPSISNTVERELLRERLASAASRVENSSVQIDRLHDRLFPAMKLESAPVDPPQATGLMPAEYYVTRIHNYLDQLGHVLDDIEERL